MLRSRESVVDLSSLIGEVDRTVRSLGYDPEIDEFRQDCFRDGRHLTVRIPETNNDLPLFFTALSQENLIIS